MINEYEPMEFQVQKRNVCFSFMSTHIFSRSFLAQMEQIRIILDEIYHKKL